MSSLEGTHSLGKQSNPPIFRHIACRSRFNVSLPPEPRASRLSPLCRTHTRPENKTLKHRDPLPTLEVKAHLRWKIVQKRGFNKLEDIAIEKI